MNDPGLLSGTLILAVFALIGVKIVTVTSRSHIFGSFEARLFLVAIVVRFMLSIGLYSFGLVEIVQDEDASGWVRAASQYQAWKMQGYAIIDLPHLLLGAFVNSSGIDESYAGYNALLGSLFLLTEVPTRLCGTAMSNFFGAMTVVLIYRTGSALFSQWVAVRAGWIVCFLPSMVLWGAETIKEPVVLFLEAAVLYGLVRLHQLRFSARVIVGTIAALVALIPFRFYAVYVISAAFALSFGISSAKKRRSNLGAASAVLACVASVLAMSGLVSNHLKIYDKYDLERLEVIRQYEYRTTGSGVDWDYDAKTYYGKAMTAVTGVVYFFFAPFPWQIPGGSLRMMVTAPEIMGWWIVLLLGVWPGVQRSLREKFDDVQPLLLFVVGLSLLYGVTFYNAGLAFRQRSQILPWLLMFGLGGFEQRILLRRGVTGRARVSGRTRWRDSGPEKLAGVEPVGVREPWLGARR